MSSLGRLGMKLTRLPGFERSRAPDLSRVATGVLASPMSLRSTLDSRMVTRISLDMMRSSSTLTVAEARTLVPMRSTVAPTVMAGGSAMMVTSVGAFLLGGVLAMNQRRESRGTATRKPTACHAIFMTVNGLRVTYRPAERSAARIGRAIGSHRILDRPQREGPRGKKTERRSIPVAVEHYFSANPANFSDPASCPQAVRRESWRPRPAPATPAAQAARHRVYSGIDMRWMILWATFLAGCAAEPGQVVFDLSAVLNDVGEGRLTAAIDPVRTGEIRGHLAGQPPSDRDRRAGAGRGREPGFHRRPRAAPDPRFRSAVAATAPFGQRFAEPRVFRAAARSR